MASGGINVRINKSTQLRIVITGLEIVERGLSVLGLARRPVFHQSVPTRNPCDFVWVSLTFGVIFYLFNELWLTIRQEGWKSKDILISAEA